jgi:hypothetical protein
VSSNTKKISRGLWPRTTPGERKVDGMGGKGGEKGEEEGREGKGAKDLGASQEFLP